MRLHTYLKRAAALFLCTTLPLFISSLSVCAQEAGAEAGIENGTETQTDTSQEAYNYGEDAYANLQFIYENFPQRTNEEQNRSESVNNAGLWIASQLESYGYEVQTHEFVHYEFTGINYFAMKPGASDKVILICAHYDSMPTYGVDDNGSGVSVVLELAKRFHDLDTPCTLEFAFFDNEEYGFYAGSCSFVYTYLGVNGLLDNILCCINLDSVGAGDRLYGYGGEYTEDNELIREWVYEEANLIADEMDIDLYTLPSQVEMFQTPTRLKGSDQYYFAVNGIPYLYMEATLWCNDDGTGGNEDTLLTCHYQTANEAFASTGGQIMHTEFDNLAILNELLPGRIEKNLHDASAIVTGMLLDITPNTEAGIAAGKAAAARAAETSAEESSSAEEELSSAENSSFEAASDEEPSDTAEDLSERDMSLDEPNTTDAPVIESNHFFVTGIFITIGTVLILLVIFLLIRSLTAAQRRRKRIRRYGSYDHKKKR